ncbi:MAG: patatin-like phospholipase family protein [Spirochaeta sp.]|nr:patatin-like phospholipase family protein [Spirochaeta sp.]
MLEFIQLGLGGGGVFDSANFLDYIAGHMPVSTFEELSIPLSVVATDYWTGESVVFTEGDLFTAIKASMAVPVLFEAVQYGDMLLIDGGTSNPVPFDLLVGQVDIVVAIDVTGRREPVADEARPGVVDMLFKTKEIMQQSIIAAKLRTAEPDIYLQPQLEGVRLLHFNKVHEIMEQAAPTAEELRSQLLGAGW